MVRKARELEVGRMIEFKVMIDVEEKSATDGKVVFRGIPLTYCPYLDSNVTRTGTSTVANPIYGINWGVFESCFLEGEYMRETGPDTAPNQHTVFTTHVDLSMNIRCTDRRRNFVLKDNAAVLAYA